jgi:transcriptional regulator with XRE-family HTH domain
LVRGLFLAAATSKKGEKNKMTRTKERSFGEVIRERRRQLDLTQEEVANRVKTSTPYVGHLESGKRNPSDKILTRLAEVLGLDRRELFFLANPRAQELLSEETESEPASAWEDFRKNEQLRRVHNVSSDEMEMLSRVALCGDVRSPRDFVYILNTVRHAVGK